MSDKLTLDQEHVKPLDVFLIKDHSLETLEILPLRRVRKIFHCCHEEFAAHCHINYSKTS